MRGKRSKFVEIRNIPNLQVHILKAINRCEMKPKPAPSLSDAEQNAVCCIGILIGYL